MKKILFIIASLSTVLFSCKKEHGSSQPQPTEKTYKVHFTVGGFSQTTIPFQTNSIGLNDVSTDTLKNSIDVLYYLVYKNNFRIRNIVQHSTDPGFGTIDDSFEVNGTDFPFNYRVVVVAGKTGLTDLYSTLDPNASADEFEYINSGVEGFFNDTFYKSITFTVPAASYNLSLDRIVAQLKVNIKDAIPATASKISVIFSDYQNISAATGLPDANTQGVTRTVQATVTPGTLNTTISSILLNIGNTFTVELKCTDAANNVLADKTISGVSCKANETTVLTGDLFASSGTNFTVTYDPAWNPPSEVTF